MSTETFNNSEIQRTFEELNPVRKAAKGSIIYYQGDSARSFYYLKKGRVRVYMTSPDGIEKTLSVASPGEILGEAAFFDKMPRVSSAGALTNCELVAVDEQRLISLIRKSPRLALELLKIQASRIRQLSDQIDVMTFLKADERVARLLLQSVKEEDGQKTVSLTHEEIAGSVGVNRVTVSKILTKLKREGIISTKYRKIVLLDSDRLERQTES